MDPFGRFQAGDSAAFAAIVRLYQRRLIGFARLFTRQRELAEEVAQETFIAAFQQRREIRGEEKLRAWLFATARRKALKMVSKRQFQCEISVEQDVLEAAAPTVGGGQGRAVLGRQVCHALQAALEELPADERELVTLRFFGGLQIKELAEALSMPMGTVGVKLGRALEKIRKSMTAQGLGLEDFLDE